MKILLALTLLMAFTKKAPPKEVIQPPIVVQPIKTALDIVSASDPNKYPETPTWSADYEEIILLTLKEYPVTKLPCSPIQPSKEL